MESTPFPNLASWKDLLSWIPQATETQLVTVFVWASQLQPPNQEARWLETVRTEVYEQLVARTSDRLRRFIIQRCHCLDVHLAEDVVQQVLIKLYLRAEQYDPQRSFWGWLFRISRNEYIDEVRRLRPGDVGIGQAGQPIDYLDQNLERRARAHATPEHLALERERHQRLEDAVAALPPLQRTIVQLKREGITGKEIAVRLGISQAYVSHLYHEAGEILLEALDG